MKSVLISIQPQWCEKIAVKNKLLEIRKTRPNIQSPFKCYIYQTHRNWVYKLLEKIRSLAWARTVMDGQGKVIGEFICDHIKAITASDFIVAEDGDRAIEGSCLTRQETKSYAGWRKGTPLWECKDLYGWHISNLVIYDKPKNLSEFRKPLECHRGEQCEECTGCWDCEITRPPQSWCYVEELKDGNRRRLMRVLYKEEN